MIGNGKTVIMPCELMSIIIRTNKVMAQSRQFTLGNYVSVSVNLAEIAIMGLLNQILLKKL